MKSVWRAMRYPLALVAAVALSLLLFFALYRWDNKYTWPAPHQAQGGILRLDTAAYDDEPLLFLVDGWEYYHRRFLTPDETATQTPDAIVYIGQYAGFDMGDAGASPHGQGTWRLTVFCGPEERDYALELPEIYSAYRLWINGALKKTEGFAPGGEYRAQTAHSMVTFTARDKIEIVVAVQDYTHFYSGMVYPPAFGSAEAVLRLVSLRLLVHAAACGIALVIALLCLFFGFRGRHSAFPILALLCVSVIAYTGYPLVHMLGLAGGAWYDVERTGYYAFLFAVIWLAGRLCGTTPRLYRPAMALAGLVALSVPVYRYAVLPTVQTAARLYQYSNLLGLWKWAAALYLLATVGAAAVRGRAHARALLAGVCVVAAALLADRALPRFEPIVSGWFGEVAGFALILLIMGVLCADALRTYRENQTLEARAGLDALRLESYRQQQALQAAYVEKSRRLTHDTKSQLLALRRLLEDGEDGEARRQIETQLGELDTARPEQLTGHRLLNTILTQFLARANVLGIQVEHRVQVPPKLRAEDADLARLCVNILDNAAEACARMDETAKRRIRLELLYAGGVLEITCENTHGGGIRQTGSRFASQKQDGALHGYGTRIIAEIAERLGGGANFTWDGERFLVEARLNLGADG